MTKREFIIGYRLFFAILTSAAIFYQFNRSIMRGYDPGNFFSFFTIESNLLAILSLALSTSYSGRKWEMFRGAVTLYMTTTGLIYIFLLAGQEQSLQTTTPWVNAVLHYVAPVVICIDWFFDRSKHYISFRKALIWICYPLAYVAYSLVRGPIVDWYPYPFIDPTANNGYLGVLATLLLIAPVMVAFVWFIAQATRAANKR